MGIAGVGRKGISIGGPAEFLGGQLDGWKGRKRISKGGEPLNLNSP